MKRSGFTMIELVMVIVMMGILASLAVPRLQLDLRQEAADNILSAIRYTQHLALLDDKHKFNNPNWQRRFWHLYFGTCKKMKFYVVGSDDDMGGSTNSRVDFTESAIDPSNGKHMWALDGKICGGGHTKDNISPNIFIGKKYGIHTITPSGGCTNKYIGFDHLGRPYNSSFTASEKPDNAGLITSTCVFSFGLRNGESFSILIEPETGYASILGQLKS